MSKIIFLDFDGPLLPVSVELPKHSNGCARMDPYGVMYINMLLEADPTIQLVISSNHALSGKDHCVKMLATNDIDIGALHKDWMTPRRMSSGRYDEIYLWLREHPEVTHHVAIDDLPLEVLPHYGLVPIFSTRVSNEDGIAYWNYLECKFHLGLWAKNETPYDLKEKANMFKSKSVMYHVPRTDQLWVVMHQTCDKLFPTIIARNDDKET